MQFHPFTSTQHPKEAAQGLSKGTRDLIQKNQSMHQKKAIELGFWKQLTCNHCRERTKTKCNDSCWTRILNCHLEYNSWARNVQLKRAYCGESQVCCLPNLRLICCQNFDVIVSSSYNY